MRGTVDMTGVNENNAFSLLPEGTYEFKISDKADKESQNGDPMVVIELTVNIGDHTGRKVWDNIVIPKPTSSAIKILGRTKHFLHCINESYDNQVNWDSDDWIGKSITARIYHEEYNGKIRAKIAEYILIGEDVIPF